MSVETLVRDLRLALRSFRRRPGFAAVALLTLAVGIGANASVFSVLNAVILRPLPFPEPHQLMRLFIEMPDPGQPGTRNITWSMPKYRALEEQQDVFQDLSTFSAARFDLISEPYAEQIDGERVGARYFPMLGIQPSLGRGFLPEEDQDEGAAKVAVLSHDLWAQKFGSDPGIVGRSIRLSGASYQVVGVLPGGFQGLTGGAQVWVPLMSLGAEAQSYPMSHNQHVLARLMEGVTPEQARGAVQAIGRRIDEMFPSTFRSERAWGAGAITLQEERADPTLRTALFLLIGAVGFVLLIACVNLANLMLARAAARSGELALRKAVGAGGHHLVRQVLAESMVLAGLGGAFGLGLAYLSTNLLRSMVPVAMGGEIFRGSAAGLSSLGFSTIRLDGGVLLFVSGLILVTMLLFGLGPAIWASRSDPLGPLKSGGNNQGFRAGPWWKDARGALVTAEVALTFLLLLGAGVMVKSLNRLMEADTGYRAVGVWTGGVSLSRARHETEELVPFYQELENRLLALPEVDFVGIGACIPLSGGCQGTDLTFVDRPSETQVEPPLVEFHPVSSGFFQALGIPVVQGRGFVGADDPNAVPVAIISQSAADQYWPDLDPLGKQIQLGQSGDIVWEIVGVTETVRFESMERENRPQVFVPFAQRARRTMHIAAHTSGLPGSLTPQVRSLLNAMEPELPLTNIRTMVDRVSVETSRERFVARLLAVFALIAATLSAMGIFGVLAFDVTQRTRDIGIRMALGAQKDAVLGGVVGRSLALAAAGAGIGLAGSFALGRVMEGLLFGVETHDTLNLVLVLGATLTVAALASLVPAFRAASVEPFSALKDR